MSKNKNPDKICFVLFGETGHGKSTLGNSILGKNVFPTNDTLSSVTKEISGHQGEGKSRDLFVIDTPGLNDSEGRDNEYLKNIATYLKKRNDIKGIVIVLNFSLKKAIQNSADKAFKTIFRIFKSKTICTHILIAFTHFYGSRKQPNRNEQGELKSIIFNIFKQNFDDMFDQKCPIKSLPFFFLDIDSSEDLDNDSQMEIDGMITTIFSKNHINPSIIQIKNDYNIKDELTSSRIIENFERFEGDYIIKKIRTFKKVVTKYYDTSLNDSVVEELVDEKEEKMMNYDLVREREKLEEQKKKEKEMHEKFKKEMEKKARIQKEKEEALQSLLEEQKKRQEELRKLEEERKRKEEEYERQKKAEEEERKLRLEREEEERRRIKEEKLRIKRERIRVCKKMKYYKEKKYNEDDNSYVSFLDETWNNGYIETPDDLKEFEIELLKTERIDMSDKAFTTITGRIYGALPGKIITGWKLINRHDNTNGGTWDRNGKVLGTNNYDFTFTSCFWRGLHWTLKLYGFKIPEDYDENKDLDESDYY